MQYLTYILCACDFNYSLSLHAADGQKHANRDTHGTNYNASNLLMMWEHFWRAIMYFSITTFSGNAVMSIKAHVLKV